MLLGKCPYCEDGQMQMQKKSAQGAITKVYTCSNATFTTQDGELFESTGSCTYRIWGNSLRRYGKRGIGEREIRTMLDEGSFIATLHSKIGTEYKKYVIANFEYGIEVLFSEEVVS